MLQVQNLTKHFTKIDKVTKQKSIVGISNISFIATPGKVFGLIGANGAGKTTTMRILANITNPQQGNITFNNKDYTQIKDLKAAIGFVSGETQVYDRLTPREILTTFGLMSGQTKSDLDVNIKKLAKELGMEEFLDITCGNFSTGMKQKTSIARALITDPKILIFDEVTNGLDIFAAKAVKDIILKLKAEGKIIVYSTHIMPDADELCEDVAFIHKGKILESGNVIKLKQQYNCDNMYQLFFKLIESSDPEIIKSAIV